MTRATAAGGVAWFAESWRRAGQTRVPQLAPLLRHVATEFVRRTCQDGHDASTHLAPDPERRTGHNHRHRAPRPPDQAPGRPVAARATSPSSTTSTSTGSPPTRSWRSVSPRCSTPSRRSPAATPTSGPEVLVKAGIPLVDDLGEGVFQQLREGDIVRIDGNTVLVGGEPVAHGTPAGRRDRRQGDGRRPRGPVGAAGGVRRQHDGIPQAGARPAARRRRRARRRDHASPGGTA